MSRAKAPDNGMQTMATASPMLQLPALPDAQRSFLSGGNVEKLDSGFPVL
jgi:hypothetical protein